MNQPPILPGPWLKLADYGDYPHNRGLQCLSRRAAGKMAATFRSLRGRLERRFGGLPIYIGHPDDPAYARAFPNADTRAYAWIRDMQAREDGLYILPKWSNEGRELLRNAFYKFLSPRWTLRDLGGGQFEPEQLLSVGLTNQPNIPGEAIANSRPPANNAPTGTQPGEAPDTAGLAEQAERFYRLACDAQDARQKAEQLLEETRTALEAERTDRERLASANAAAPRIARSTGLASRAAAHNHSPREAFLTAVNTRMQESGGAYTAAWAHVRHARPDLYESLATPAGG